MPLAEDEIDTESPYEVGDDVGAGPRECDAWIEESEDAGGLQVARDEFHVDSERRREHRPGGGLDGAGPKQIHRRGLLSPPQAAGQPDPNAD